MTPAEIVIDVLGVRGLARELDMYPSAITRWKVTGLVPSKHHKKLIELADGKISADDLVFGRHDE